MALNFIPMDPDKGAEVLNLLKRMGSDLAALKIIHKSMIEKIDGDGSADAHFPLLVTAYGYPTTAEAHRSFAEISATVGGSGALEQCAAYHRQT